MLISADGVVGMLTDGAAHGTLALTVDFDGSDGGDEKSGKWPESVEDDDAVSVPAPDSVEPRCPFTSEDTVLLHAAAHPHNQPFDSTSLIVHAGDDTSVTALTNVDSSAAGDEGVLDLGDPLELDTGESDQLMEQDDEDNNGEQEGDGGNDEAVNPDERCVSPIRTMIAPMMMAPPDCRVSASCLSSSSLSPKSPSTAHVSRFRSLSAHTPPKFSFPYLSLCPFQLEG